jgi:hypothetical protein
MIRGCRQLGSRLRPRAGQSLTEFAIMLPLLVLVVWFSVYFIEVIIVRLKLQEAARYATWEYTAYPLHDYSDGDRYMNFWGYNYRFSKAMGVIMTEATARYEDLNSSDGYGLPPLPQSRRNTMMATGWQTPLFVMVQGWKPNLTGEFAAEWGLRTVMMAASAVAGRIAKRAAKNPLAAAPVARSVAQFSTLDGMWGFNRQGWVFTRVRTEVYNVWMPREIRVGRFSFSPNPRVTIWEKSALLADAWQLHDGRDVQHGTEKNKGFTRQVRRIFLLNRRAAAPVDGAIQWLRVNAGSAPMSGMLPVPQPTPNAAEPVVVSLNHRHALKQSRGVTNFWKKNLGWLHGEMGRVVLQTNGGRMEFDTAPLFVKNRVGKTPYLDTLQQRGEHFMGCPEPMNTTCGAGLTTSPFGNGVHWPPPGGR